MNRHRTHRRTALILSTAALLPAAFTAGRCPGGQKADFYTGEKVYKMRPRPDREKHFGHIGVTGIVARVYRGVAVRVERVEDGTPAAGKLKKGQVITGVNGAALAGRNPYVALGEALAAAEATDGKLVFTVREGNSAAARKVAITIPAIGGHADTWPLNCETSRKIVNDAAAYYGGDEAFAKKHLRGRGIGGALACLFLLSTGDDRYLPRVTAYFERFPDDATKIGSHTWNNGYNGIACAEYYLRTGDESVLPIIQHYCDDARDRQHFGCSWTHWGRGVNPGYVAGGLMNPAGAQVLTTLLLAKACGVDVDEKTLLGALRFWYRFAGHGTVPYGDHRPEGGLGSNGKDGMAAAVMQAASRAKGNVAIYDLAKRRFSYSTVTSYPVMVCGHGDNGRGDALWRGIGSVHTLETRPKVFHAVMNRLTWWYVLSRRPGGGFGIAGLERFDDPGSGAGLALAYTAPLKTLQITGAPRSPHAVAFTLPAELWGNTADRAFLAVRHNAAYLKRGDPEPIHRPFYRYGSAYDRPAVDPKEAAQDEMVRNVCHERYMIRAQAAKALRAAGAFDTLENLLRDPDPRVRRAALDGMIDYRYWFSIGRGHIKTGQFTPGMVAAIRKMIADPAETWWVVDGALMALAFAPAKDIGACLPLIMPWTKHDDWWLRESSFTALTGLKNDDALLMKALPTMTAMMVDEYHTQPRQRMAGALRKILKEKKKDSPAGKAILAAFRRAVRESEIKPNRDHRQRAAEGAYNVVTAADVCLRESPETALAVAAAIRDRFEHLDTKQVIQIVGSPGSKPEGRPFGLYTVREKVPPAQRKKLDEVLCEVYLPELQRRMKAASGTDMSLISTVIDLAKIRDPAAGWKPIGTPPPAERTWRFISFDPQREQDKKPCREKKRFRKVALPKGLEKWYEPDFDDSRWNKGRAPIGVGAHKRGRVRFENKSDWGDGEFLLARTTFDLDAVDGDRYRLSILCRQGFHVYLNGHGISRYGWWKDQPYYRPIMLNPGHIKRLKKGRNVLAVYTNVEYRTGDPDRPVGQIDAYIEGLKKEDLE